MGTDGRCIECVNVVLVGVVASDMRMEKPLEIVQRPGVVLGRSGGDRVVSVGGRGRSSGGCGMVAGGMGGRVEG